MSSDNAPSRIPVPKHRARFPTPGAAPGAGQSGQRGGSRRRRGDQRRGEIQIKKEWVITGMIGLLLLMAIGGFWLMGRMHSKGKAELPVVDRAETPAPVEKWQGPIPSVIAERFVHARNHEERLGLVRNPDQVGPAMEAFFKSGIGATERLTGFYPLATGSSGNISFETYAVEFANSPPRRLSVSIDPLGAKVDFKCYARFCSVAWDDLISGKVTEAAEVRVVLEPGGYYLRNFSDEQKWLHFKATSPDLPQTLDFYLDRQSPAVSDVQDTGSGVLPETMSISDRPGSRNSFPAILSIRSVDGSEKHRQFEITAMKALDWVEPD